MKKGKIVLGTAAFIVTAASALAFKVTHRFTQRHGFGTKGSVVACTRVTCFTANSSGTNPAHCLTIGLSGATVTNVYTEKTATGHHCVHPTRWTRTND
jgi:hypothetical protein